MHTSSSAIDFQQGLSGALSSYATFVLEPAEFLAILFIGWIIARLVAAIIDRVLERVGFDRLVERGGIERMLSRSRYDASELLAKLAYYAILLIALQIGFGVFGPNPVSVMLNDLVARLPDAAVAIVIVVIAGVVAYGVRDTVATVLSGLSHGTVISKLAAVFLWAIGLVAALNRIGVATSVTTPILITVLATVGGILVIDPGGGMIRPMRRRREGGLGHGERDLPEVEGHARTYLRGREDVAREQLWIDQQATRGQRWIPDEYPPGDYAPGGYPRTGMPYREPRDLL
ncbi:hypothetical protein [Nocardia sp. NPDC050710]|uniref:mechanosensitive ion channel family protein n=1 Tax=Nocardia sp. NPDC050710 TaxID=3157220 RepID=UPI0033C5F3E9